MNNVVTNVILGVTATGLVALGGFTLWDKVIKPKVAPKKPEAVQQPNIEPKDLVKENYNNLLINPKIVKELHDIKNDGIQRLKDTVDLKKSQLSGKIAQADALVAALQALSRVISNNPNGGAPQAGNPLNSCANAAVAGGVATWDIGVGDDARLINWLLNSGIKLDAAGAAMDNAALAAAASFVINPPLAVAFDANSWDNAAVVLPSNSPLFANALGINSASATLDSTKNALGRMINSIKNYKTNLPSDLEIAEKELERKQKENDEKHQKKLDELMAQAKLAAGV